MPNVFVIITKEIINFFQNYIKLAILALKAYIKINCKIKQNKVTSSNSEDRTREICHANRGFLETLEVGIIAIFVLPKYESELKLLTSDISFNSVNP